MRTTTAKLWVSGVWVMAVACGGGGEDDAEGGGGSSGAAGRTGGAVSDSGSSGGGAGSTGRTGSGTSGGGAAGDGASGTAGTVDAGVEGGTDAGMSDLDAALPSTDKDAICTRDGACEASVELAPGQHMEGDIDYGELPPAGGPHNPCWGDFGIHDELFPPENWVHNLEHGAVVFLHACPDACADELTALEGFVAERSWAILSPSEGMHTRFAVVAWGYRLMTDELDLDAFADFYDAHADQAPESVPSGKPAGCP